MDGAQPEEDKYGTTVYNTSMRDQLLAANDATMELGSGETAVL